MKIRTSPNQLISFCAAIAMLAPTTLFSATNSSSFTAAPPFVATSVGKPNVVVALDISGSMKAVAYRDVSAGSWHKDTTVHDDFDPDKSYFGYFDSESRYTYNTDPNKLFFVIDNATGEWDGNFLNWLTMRRMDVVRKVLVGGKVRDRAGELIGGETWYVIEGQNEPEDRTFRKSYSDSSTVSPFDNDTEILIADGVVQATSGSNRKVIPLSTTVEIGQLSIDRDTDEDDDLSEISHWHTVTLANTYTNPMIVVSGLSYNGSDPSHTRVRNVTATSFEVRLEEWAYRDIDHTTELVTYIAAEHTGGSGAPNIVQVDSTDYEVRAGSITTNATVDGAPSNVFAALTDRGYTPVVFSGVTTTNAILAPSPAPTPPDGIRPVISRVDNVGTTGFNISLQNEEQYAPNHFSAETAHWIAFQPVSGISDLANAAIEIGDSGGTNVDSSFNTIAFSSPSFNTQPIMAVSSQTIDGSDPAYPRYRNVTSTDFQVKMEEEKSGDDETTHVDERIGYLAIDSISGFKIQVGVNQEPEGVVQENSGALRFGLAVYNYDHSRNPTSIYTGNKVHGGTFRACYPDISKTVADRDNFDICYDTHVKSPLSNIIEVIEDHPLIWGSTPIAETLYDIKGYFGQINHNRNGHTQWYDNGKEGIAGNSTFDGLPKARNSYEVNNDWDPFYYEEYGAKLPCAKSFVLHFNDGAPYRDFDGDAAQHPAIPNIGGGSFGPQDKLDDLALVLRQNDCRTDTGMDGFQEIISYYVYAALGEEEAGSATRRVKEAAVNGGFIDLDGDRAPYPVNNGAFPTPTPTTPPPAIPCDPEDGDEWDENGDCNPDAFFFANDGAALVNELNEAFEAIATRAATGGASSVIAASKSGEGSVVNAIFRPFVSSGEDEVTWIGDVHALMIDDAGDIRQDNGNKILEGPELDPYLDMCSNTEQNLVRAALSNDKESRPTASDFSSCNASVFGLDLFDIEYLWSGADWLSSLDDADATTQRSYSSTSLGRHIITGIDSDGNGIIQNAEQVPFLASSFPEEYAGLLSPDLTTSHTLIDYIRGEDQAGLRPRALENRTMRLGDIIYSTPTIVGRPSENIDILYDGESYRAFFDRYRYRRQVIYAGGNDGMLHAFNGGWYNPTTKEFLEAKGGADSAGSLTNYDLGAEMWAYVPYNTLPHLEYLARPTYGSVSSDHLYFVDLKPRIFDAKIFPVDADHPGGWGTVLVVGMRLGGGATTVDIDLDATNTDNRTLRSSLAIFDITNPDNPPKLLLEYTHPNLGFTTAVPSPITTGTDNEGNGGWYLMIGSGADTTATGFEYVKSTQNGRLFLLDLKAVVAGNSNVLETSFGSSGIYTLSDANSFVSDLTPVDFGLDMFTTDAVYFGTVTGDETNWGGKINRVMIQPETGEPQEAIGSWAPTQIIDAGEPVTAPISIAVDRKQNRWLFTGTGRYLTPWDNLNNDTNYYYGLKEPRNATGEFTYGAISHPQLANITTTGVQVRTGILDPAPALSPALPVDATVSTLEKRIAQFSDSSTYVAGWQRNFAGGERNFGSGTLLAKTLTYTTFDPVFDECSIQGTAYLFVVNAFTGTASKNAIVPQSETDTHNTYVIDIGGSPATSPSLHKGEGYTTNKKTTAIVQTANGNILTVDQDNSEQVRDGEMSWRQLR